jgi:hypothetical protein
MKLLISIVSKQTNFAEIGPTHARIAAVSKVTAFVAQKGANGRNL